MNEELLLDENYSDHNLSLTNTAKNHLSTTAKWGKFLAVLGYIFSGLMLIGSLSLAFSGPMFGDMPGLSGGMFSLLALLYVVFAGMYVYLSYLLYSFCSQSQQAIQSSDSLDLENAFNQLKKVFVTIGVSTIVFIVLYIVFIAIMVGGVASFF